jgi:cell division protein FtsB
MNKEGQEMIADLFLRIEELEKENKELKEEIEKLKQPDGLELAMREEWEKYENVLREN